MWCGAGQAAGVGTAFAVPGGAGIEHGIVQVVCATDAPRIDIFSTGAVLDLGSSATRDVILTTAHGLPVAAESIVTRCSVLGPRRRAYAIDAVWRSAEKYSGPSTDWAVLLTAKRVRGDVGRLPAGQIHGSALIQLVAAEAPVRLLLRSALADPRDCHLVGGADAAYDAAFGVVYHSCRSRPGVSGSPIVMSVDDRPVVVAIHIGRQMWLLGRRGGASVGKSLDGEVAAAIAKAALRAKPASRPRRP